MRSRPSLGPELEEEIAGGHKESIPDDKNIGEVRTVLPQQYGTKLQVLLLNPLKFYK